MNKAFTLVEMLVAISILAIIASIASASAITAYRSACAETASVNAGLIEAAKADFLSINEFWSGNSTSGTNIAHSITGERFPPAPSGFVYAEDGVVIGATHEELVGRTFDLGKTITCVSAP